MQLGWEYENCSLDAMSCQHSAWQHDVMNVGRMFWKCCANACGNQLHFTVTLNRKTYTNDQLLNERFVRMQMDSGGTQLHWNTCIFQMSHHVTPTGRTCNYILLSSLYLHVYLLNCINQYILFDFFCWHVLNISQYVHFMRIRFLPLCWIPGRIPRSKLLQALARRGSMKVKAFVLYAAEVKEEQPRC